MDQDWFSLPFLHRKPLDITEFIYPAPTLAAMRLGLVQKGKAVLVRHGFVTWLVDGILLEDAQYVCTYYLIFGMVVSFKSYHQRCLASGCTWFAQQCLYNPKSDYSREMPKAPGKSLKVQSGSLPIYSWLEDDKIFHSARWSSLLLWGDREWYRGEPVEILAGHEWRSRFQLGWWWGLHWNQSRGSPPMNAFNWRRSLTQGSWIGEFGKRRNPTSPGAGEWIFVDAEDSFRT